MKAVVCIKRVLDYNLKPRIKSDNLAVDLSNTKMSMNPFDEIAVEEAIILQEKGIIAEIVVVSIGNTDCKEIIRSALALGANRGILVEYAEELSSLNTAKILANIIQTEKPEIVLLGKQAIDNDANQTGQMLAELLNWSQATFISNLSIQKNTAVVIRETDQGLEELICQLPAIFTTDLRLNVPRYTKLPDIIKAKQKEIKIINFADLPLKIHTCQKIIRMEEVPKRQAGKIVQSVEELLNCLKQEAKVI